MPEPLHKQFHHDLQTLRALFLRMGGVVESMIEDSTELIATGELALAERVREREKSVNQLEVDIDERISQLIARHQPIAIDLRVLLSVSKMLTDMERCGDEADKIAKVARRLYEADAGYTPVVELRHMGKHVAGMLRDVLDAFERADPPHAARVVRDDKDVDREWKGALRHIITYMIEDPRTISRSIDLIFIARSLERIGDHAKNMAERVIYMVRGDDVRHTGVKNTERLARGDAPDVPPRGNAPEVTPRADAPAAA